MEQCETPSGCKHPWKETASVKRRAWAQSRDSWQAPESQDQDQEQAASEDTASPSSAAAAGATTTAAGMEEKPSAGAQEPGQIPNKIASWLQDCRTPLGASLDEQSSTPTKGVSRNGCSFEDDLSLGAEANHLQLNGTKAEVPCYAVAAKEKRSQFKQKGRSMNSTGSGRSNTTVSSGLSSSLSVSELLDLYEEDPEEVLYNLGFGREEPNISAKVPSRFFNGSSGARGIDIKVYLNAQLQRMELENPNYALTSRFRQIEVLTTVANAFSSLYSQVSGLPVQKIGNPSLDAGGAAAASAGEAGGGGGDSSPEDKDKSGAAKEHAPIARTPSNSTLNAVKILKKRVTRHNLFAGASPEGGGGSLVEGGGGGGGGGGGAAAAAAAAVTMTTNSDPSSLGVDVGVGAGTGTAEDPSSPVDLKPQKVFRKKDSPPLATVTEEGLLGSTESSCSNGEAPHSTTAGLAAKPATHTSGEGQEEQGQAQPQTMELPEGCVVEGSLVVVGLESPVRVSISGVSEESGGGPLEEEQEEVLQKAITSTPDKEPSSNLLPNPLLEHLRTSPQARESFEMDELQEDEPGTRSTSRAGSELLRTASQQSDSSGFAEDPSTDCSANYLKVQESSDSCDSETTVTSHAGDATTPLATDTPTSTFDLDTPALLETHSEEVEEEEEQERLAEKQKEELERGEEEEEEEVVLEVPGYNVHQFSRLAETKELELSVPLEAPSPANKLGSATDPSSSAEKEATEAGLVGESTSGSTKDSNSGGLEKEKGESTMQQPSPEASSADGEVRGMGRLNPSDRVRTALHRAKERSVSVCDDRVGGGGDGGVQSPGSRAQELRKARLSRAPLQKSHSLPTSLLTPSRVVSSLRIQLGHGSIRHCTTPTFSYRYTADAEGAMEVCSIKEEGCSDEEEEDVEVEEEGGEEGRQASSRQSTLDINARGGPPDQVSGSGVPDMPFSRIRPYPPSMPGHLTMSTTSLYSGTPHQHHQQHDWSPLHRPLSEGGGWSSVPNLTMTPQGHHHHHHHHPHAPSPSPLHGLQHLQHNAPPQFQFRSPYPNTTTPGTGLLGSPHASLNSSFNSALAPPTPASCLTTPSPTPLFFSPPQSAYFTPPQSVGMFQNNSNNAAAASASALYGQMHGMVSPYGSPFHSQQHQQHQQQQQQQQMPQPQQYHQQQQQQQQQQPQTAQPDGRYGSPVPSYSPLVHPHSAPYSMQQYSTPPPSVLGQPYPHHPHPQYSGPPYFPFPQQMAPHPLVHTPSPPQAPSSTEMQLRRVLHEIRGTVQNLAQSSTPCPGDNPPDAFSPQRSVQSLYEELQVRKRSLAVFRTQMMDLELALMRQQSQVYQHLNQDERLEAEQLQGLRGAVRQELQELELQVEDRLLTLNEQLRTAPNPAFYRHPMAMLRGQSLDSLSNALALEPVSELLREQLYLQSELGYEGGLSRATTPLSSSGRSSGTASPSRGVSSSFSSSRPPPHTSSSSSPQRGALYRASVNLTPAAPPRPGQEASSFFAQEAEVVEGGQQMGEEEVEGGGGGSVGRCSSTSTGGEQGSQAAINPHLLEERGQDGGQGAGGGAGGGGRSVTERAVENPHLQQLIKEIKDSIADEIRQEIVSELLAAVGPRRTATPSREQQQQQQP